MKVLRLLPVLVISTSALACSFLVGTSDLATVDGPGDVEAGSDAAPGGSTDAGIDGSDQAPDAGGVGDAACAPSVRVDEAFATSLGGWAKHSFSGIGPFDYPMLEVYDGVPSAVLLPIRGPNNELYSSRSALFFPSVVPLVALDVSADVDVRCTSPTSCADGVMMMWLDTRDPSVLDHQKTGGDSLPDGVSGAGVVLDTYQAPQINDPPAPSMQIITPGRPGATEADAWRVAHIATPFPGAPHRIGIRLRGDRVSVTYDGTVRLTGTVPGFTSGLFGFVAGTGGQTDAVAIRNVTASFYPCTPP